MCSFQNPYISIAKMADHNAIKDLLNIAYRGEASAKGWTTEAKLISGETRVDDLMLRKVMELEESVFLKYVDDAGRIAGCVNLQKQVEKMYIGMFSVQPQLQGSGIGKAILKASEEYAIYKNCSIVYMSVISLRTELIDWYVRHGYSDTGKRIPFIEDAITGKHLQSLEFMMLEKSVT